VSDTLAPPALPLTPPEAVTAMRVVGQRVAHHDFVDKVKGSLYYAADWQLPGMLHARLVRSLVPSARIVSIDTEEALALPGVAAVLTGADVPRNSLVERASGGLGELLVPMPILAAERVRYVGEPIAVVAAVTQQVADEAAELVAVEYEELPGLFDMEAALEPGAPLVHDEGNVLVSWHIGRGDVDAALAAADVVVEGMSSTPTWNPRPASAGWRATWSPCAPPPRSSSTRRRSPRSSSCRPTRCGSSPRTWAAGSAARRT